MSLGISPACMILLVQAESPGGSSVDPEGTAKHATGQRAASEAESTAAPSPGADKGSKEEGGKSGAPVDPTPKR